MIVGNGVCIPPYTRLSRITKSHSAASGSDDDDDNNDNNNSNNGDYDDNHDNNSNHDNNNNASGAAVSRVTQDDNTQSREDCSCSSSSSPMISSSFLDSMAAAGAAWNMLSEGTRGTETGRGGEQALALQHEVAGSDGFGYMWRYTGDAMWMLFVFVCLCMSLCVPLPGHSF